MVNLKDIKKLRLLTKAGIMDCRQALEASGGDFAQAQKWLLKKGAKLAKKKAGRAVKAGVITSYVHAGGRIGAMVKLDCETDFVAKNKDFQKLSYELAMQVAAMNPSSLKELLEQEYIRDPKMKIKDLLKETIAKIKENIVLTDFKRLEV